MNKKFLSLAVAATLVVSAVGVGSAFANENGEGNNKGKALKMNQEKFIETWSQLSDEEKEAKLFEHAEKLGIDTKGKTFEDVQTELQELREVRLIERAEKQGIETDGKSIEEIKEELKANAPKHGKRGSGQKGKGLNLEKLAENWDDLTEEQQNKFFERAAEQGIETEGKTFEEVSAELQAFHEAKLIEKAEEQGIETEGKTIEEIKEELKANAPEQGKRDQKGKRLNQDKFVEAWDQLSDEEKEAKLFEHAEELGIETEGKSLENVQTELEELREDRVIDRAQELGIDTEGKTIDEIIEEMKELSPKKGSKHEVTL
ncbi:hypothetical protein [Chengkuizengella axinellae]|uniref:Uncharacterized protein n=1 Tax=Chengkuizengella axinellae TaxID=3064388 RepID=A0ABT9IX76_9BACL|nr:hypothetical protein [Chengkuizengella sp. 2205SS18-9]MDP5273935.1 hypothetical protein [Chengkuizengella sp. 2205SS18-9]